MIGLFLTDTETKSLKGLNALLKKISYHTLSTWCDDRLLEYENDGKETFFIVRIPQETNILPSLWDQVAEPGWHIKIQFEGTSRLIEEVLQERAQKADENSKEKTDDKADGETNMMQDITYVAKIYQQDGSWRPDFVGKQTFKEPVVNQIQMVPGTFQTVLCEVQNVFISQWKKDTTKDQSDIRIGHDDIFGQSTLEVHSMPLLDALKAVVEFQSPDEGEYDRGFRLAEENSTHLESGRFQFPYLDLYHHMDELIAYKSKINGPRQRHSAEYNKECDRHIDILINYLVDQPIIALSKATIAWSQKVPITIFGWLWLLLKPGSDVYVRERGHLNAYVIESVDGISRYSTERPKPYVVKVWNLDFDGKVFGRSSKTIWVPVFDGEREIQSLPLFPVRFHQDTEGEKSLRDGLIERGKKFFKLIKHPTYQEYTGPSSFSKARTVCILQNSRFDEKGEMLT